MKERVLRCCRNFLVRIAETGGLFRLLALGLYRLGMQAAGVEAAFRKDVRAAEAQYGGASKNRKNPKKNMREIRFCRLVYGTSPREFILYGFAEKDRETRRAYVTDLSRKSAFHVLNNRIYAAYLENREEMQRVFGCVCNESLPADRTRLMIGTYRDREDPPQILWCYLREAGACRGVDPVMGPSSVPCWQELLHRIDGLTARLPEVRLVEWTFVSEGSGWILQGGDPAPGFEMPQYLAGEGMGPMLKALTGKRLPGRKESEDCHG